MDFGHDRRRIHLEGDRLSSLPDDLIHKILSFISIKHVIETSVLSSRWRLIWTTMPHLNFSSKDFPTLPKFSKFVTHVLYGRNNQIDVFSVELSSRGKINHTFTKIMNYAVSHNVQQLTVTYLLEKDIEFPLSIFSSQSLKHLTFANKASGCRLYVISLASTWVLPALTTLHLHEVSLCADNSAIFSKCANLKSLTINQCRLIDSNGIRICHPLLSNLTLEKGSGKVNVVAPQLKNLTIRDWSKEIQISAPELTSFLYTGYHFLHLSTDGFYSLEKVDLHIHYPCNGYAPRIVRLLEQFQSVKFFTLNLEIVEILSSKVELISDQPSPFSNLESLKIYPASPYLMKASNMSTEVKNYLLDGSPSATCTFVSREEIRAQKHIADLKALLECEKVNMEHGQSKAQVENKRLLTEKQPHAGVRLNQIRSCLEDLTQQVEEGKRKAYHIISMLQEIEGLLTKVPTSQRAKIQECFPTLCAEADAIIYKTINCIKFQCDKKQSRVSDYIHQLSTASQLLS